MKERAKDKRQKQSYDRHSDGRRKQLENCGSLKRRIKLKIKSLERLSCRLCVCMCDDAMGDNVECLSLVMYLEREKKGSIKERLKN